MEYEKIIISLYKQENPLPQMFVEFNIRSDRTILSLKQSSFKPGILILYDFDKFTWCEVKSNHDEFNLNLTKHKPNKFVVLFVSDEKFFGQNGHVLINKEIESALEKIYNKILLKKEEQNKKDYDKNDIVDEISIKLFGEIGQEFFENTKRSVLSLFALGSRAEFVEKKVKNSKFVCVHKTDSVLCVGIINKNNRPYAIAIGSPVQGNIEEVGLSGSKKYIIENEKIWEFTVRKASDGDIL